MEGRNEVIRKQRKGIDAFFEKNYALFFAPAIVLIIYLSFLWIGGVYPFGEKYTGASYDLSAQICPFIEHFYDVWEGRAEYNFTYAVAGGADLTGTFLYFFVSPFSFLFFLFGEGKVMHASSIVMACKLATIAFSGTWFAKKLFKGIPSYICIAVGVVYAYCGYTFVASTYINWVDFLIYTPFCAGAFCRFVKTENFWPFAILMACCIYTCFSIACFSMFIVFPTLVAYGLICVEKGKKFRYLGLLCVAFAVAIALALPVLFPALASYSNGGRGGSLLDGIWFGYEKVSGGTDKQFNVNTFFEKWTNSMYAKWSYILSDSVFLALTVVWFVKNGLGKPLVRFMFVAGVFTLLPTVVDESMLLLNMGSYMSYALRFGFLNAVYFLGGACLCISELCQTKEKHRQEKLQAETQTITQEGFLLCKKKIWGILEDSAAVSFTVVFVVLVALCAVLLAGTLFFAIFIHTDVGGEFYEKYKNAAVVLETLKTTASSLAHSLGGIELIAFLLVVTAVPTIFACILLANKKTCGHLIAVLLIAVVGLQVLVYNQQLVYGNRSTQHTTIAKYRVLADELNERDDGYFRIKDYGMYNKDKTQLSPMWTACIPLLTDSNSFGVFSSMIDAKNFATYQLFAYQGNGKNSYKSTHSLYKYNRGEAFGDSLLGYKYFVIPGGDTRKDADKLAHLEKVMVKDEQGKDVHLSYAGYYVYENKAVFPLGFKVSGEPYRFVAPNESNSTYRRKNQAALYEFLRGENLKESTGKDTVTEEIALELSEYLHTKAADVQVGTSNLTATVTASKGEYLLLSFVATEGYTVTVNGKKAEIVDNDLKLLMVALDEGENVVCFTYDSPYTNCGLVGIVMAAFFVAIVVFLTKKWKARTMDGAVESRLDKTLPLIGTCGLLFAIFVVAFFMVFPTGVFAWKWVESAWCGILKLLRWIIGLF